MISASRRAGEFLVDRKVLSRDQLEEALTREESTGVPATQQLVNDGVVHQRDIVAFVAQEAGMDFWDPTADPISTLVMGMLPLELARNLHCLPVRIEGRELLVAFADLPSDEALAQVHQETRWQIRPVLASREDLDKTIDEVYNVAPLPSATETPRSELPSLDDLLRIMVDLGASDLHLSSGRPPSVRIDGSIKPLEGYPVLDAGDLREMIYAILPQRSRERFETDLELDASRAVVGVGRFRINVFQQKDSVGAVFRAIPFEVVPLADLGLPDSIRALSELPRGLVLVTGPTGSGKSTTLASLVDVINSTRASHIMTVEDPIEFLHSHKRCVVNQREVGQDTKSFANALRHVLRQDPDIILVGEMRDLETMSTALTAAETGHLVFATLHTQDAPQSVDRMIDVFPAHQQGQIRVQLASALRAVVTQQLIPRAKGRGRAVAAEVLICVPAVQNLIREGKTHQIYSAMQGGGRYGMQTMDQSLAELVRAGTITMAAALERCAVEADIRRLVNEHG
jgi:twitching motility protein PilT